MSCPLSIPLSSDRAHNVTQITPWALSLAMSSSEIAVSSERDHCAESRQGVSVPDCLTVSPGVSARAGSGRDTLSQFEPAHIGAPWGIRSEGGPERSGGAPNHKTHQTRCKSM